MAHRLLSRARLVVAVVGAVTLLLPGSAAAVSSTVTATPAPWTPYVTSTDATVRQLVPSGGTMYAVGSFSQIGNSSGQRFARSNIFAFSATTGAVSAWAPQPNGTVYSATVSADGQWIYLGGAFTSIGGVSAPYLAKVSTSTGAVDTSFRPRPNSQVRAVVLMGSHLLAGGTFSSIGGVSTRALGSVDPITGANDGYLNLNVAGVAPNDWGTYVLKFAPSHLGDRLLVMGGFTSVSGQRRQQIFMVDLGTTPRLDAWNAPVFLLACASSIPQYTQAAAWSPDDSAVFAATTGYRGASPICDAAAKFPSTAASVSPTWVNKTGCDSLYSVAATDTTVYIGGHERWANNPNGCDNAGPGAVSRPGVGALDITTGLATSWNPTRSRGHAADDMVFTSAGLWVASDNQFSAYYCANAYHPGICMFPYSG